MTKKVKYFQCKSQQSTRFAETYRRIYECMFLIYTFLLLQTKHITKHARAYEFCETIRHGGYTPYSVSSRYICMDDSIVSAFKFKLNK